jgi:aspartate kinase
MRGVTKIDYCDDISLISYNAVPADIAFMADIFGAFSDAGIVIDMIAQTAPVGNKTSISFTCPDKDMVKVLEIFNALKKSHNGVTPLVSGSNSKIQLYGEEMRTAHGVFAAALDVLRDKDIELKQVTTSEVDISLLVDAAHVAVAMEALKTCFKL